MALAETKHAFKMKVCVNTLGILNAKGNSQGAESGKDGT